MPHITLSSITTAALALISTHVPTTLAFAPRPFLTTSSKPTSPKNVKIHTLDAMIDPSTILGQSTDLLAYSDDPVGDLLGGVNGAVIAGILATVVAVGVGFTALLPSVGKAKFTLTDEEEDAVQRVKFGYDSKPWEQEITEEGSKGFVDRKRRATEAKEKYQSGKIAKEIKDRSLRYAETDLGFIACLLRAAEPNAGDVLVDLGSGAGRSTLGAAAVFPGFGKCIGVEFLEPLVKLSNTYKGRVKGKKAPVEFVCADFAEYDLSGADLVFASATYFSNADFDRALSTLPSGAKVMTIDRRLGGGYKLISSVDDPSGDLVLNAGYVYEKL